MSLKVHVAIPIAAIDKIPFRKEEVSFRIFFPSIRLLIFCYCLVPVVGILVINCFKLVALISVITE